jgi:phosphatidylserine/phosphatidylglycerophosphate/cardiolipin synthase-like enzyme
LLIDGSAYFAALRAALRDAKHSVFILGWDIRSDISLDPAGTQEPLGAFLDRLVRDRAGLEIRVLIWDWVLLYGLERQPLPEWHFGMKTHERLHFVLDGEHPTGACHHEKLVVIDGELAFAGGIDLSAGRWDTPAHRSDEPCRNLPGDSPRPPRHDCMLMVEGAAARALDGLARERWRLATGEDVGEPPADPGSRWPDSTNPWITDVPIGIARTRAAYGGRAAVQEIEALYPALIDAADHVLYIENQYLTVRRFADRVRARLEEPDGPEVVMLTPTTAEGLLEAVVMDQARARFVDRLAGAGDEARLRVRCPVTLGPDGRRQHIDLHTKLAIVDDAWLTVGSANLANRSMGLDSECNLVVAARTDDHRRAIADARTRLLADHLGCDAAEVDAALERRGSVIAVLDELESAGKRLEPLPEVSPAPGPATGVAVELGDPPEPIDAGKLKRLLLPDGPQRRLGRPLRRLGIALQRLLRKRRSA